jgi:predicted AAA+ superfamily ATPase
MKERVIYRALFDHCKKKQVTVINGMRRVGKSTAVKYLLKRLGSSNCLYFDCERIEIRVLFNSTNYEGIKSELELMGIDFSQPAIIALDEIQLVENLPSVIKYFYYMKNRFSESLAGRKRIFEMYPLSFSEFLSFKELTPPGIEKYAWKPFDKAWHTRLSAAYAEYIRFGGFPEVVLEEGQADKVELLKDIINSYIEIDVKLLADYSVSEGLYKLIKVLAARTGNKVDFTKISSVTGINRQKIANYIQLLESTYLIYQAKPFTKNIDKEISQQTKLYFADTGILQVLAGDQLSSGQVFENAVAVQLSGQGTIQYYQKKTGQEIDFIFNGEMAIEVKETPSLQNLQTISQRAMAIGINKYCIVGRNQPGSDFVDFTWGGNIY